jgi:hypothetical protein
MRKKNLWHFLPIVCVFLLVQSYTAAGDEIQLSTSQSYQGSGIKAGLRLMGGGILIGRNDINDELKGANDFYEDRSDIIVLSGKYKPANTLLDFMGEFFVNFAPNLELGIGSGYFTGGKESTVITEWPSSGVNEKTVFPKFSAVPITLSLYYGVPISNSMKVRIGAGAGYYLGSVEWEEYRKYDSEEYEQSWSAKSNALGFHGVVHFELKFTQHSAFVVGAKGRYVVLKNLVGDKEWRYLGGNWGTEEDYILWSYIFEDSATGNKYPGIGFSDEKVKSQYFSDVEEGDVSLSGIVFQAGIKVTF